jgi:hypothetical protein
MAVTTAPQAQVRRDFDIEPAFFSLVPQYLFSLARPLLATATVLQRRDGTNNIFWITILGTAATIAGNYMNDALLVLCSFFSVAFIH